MVYNFVDATGNHLWSDPDNWDRMSVPTAADDVIIDSRTIVIDTQVSCYNLTITGTAIANSLQEGVLRLASPLKWTSNKSSVIETKIKKERKNRFEMLEL
jgi:hypothetical protein